MFVCTVNQSSWSVSCVQQSCFRQTELLVSDVVGSAASLTCCCRLWARSLCTCEVFHGSDFICQLCSSSSSRRSSGPAGVFLLQGRGRQVENGSEGQAILGQTDGVMIADADWLASHSHPRISVWTVTYETSKACQLLSVFSFAMSKNTRTKEFAAENLRFTIR